MASQAYWCYQCNRTVHLRPSEPLCSVCGGGFIEEVQSEPRGEIRMVSPHQEQVLDEEVIIGDRNHLQGRELERLRFLTTLATHHNSRVGHLLDALSSLVARVPGEDGSVGGGERRLRRLGMDEGRFHRTTEVPSWSPPQGIINHNTEVLYNIGGVEGRRRHLRRLPSILTDSMEALFNSGEVRGERGDLRRFPSILTDSMEALFNREVRGEGGDSRRLPSITNDNMEMLFNRGGVTEGGNSRRLPGSVGDYFLGPHLDQLIEELTESDPPLSKNGTPPAAKSAVEALPTFAIATKTLSPDMAQCAVCMDAFEPGVKAKQMPCLHLYHLDCILPWLADHNSCPVCRYQLPTEDADYNEAHSLLVSPLLETHSRSETNSLPVSPPLETETGSPSLFSLGLERTDGSYHGVPRMDEQRSHPPVNTSRGFSSPLLWPFQSTPSTQPESSRQASGDADGQPYRAPRYDEDGDIVMAEILNFFHSE